MVLAFVFQLRLLRRIPPYSMKLGRCPISQELNRTSTERRQLQTPRGLIDIIIITGTASFDYRFLSHFHVF